MFLVKESGGPGEKISYTVVSVPLLGKLHERATMLFLISRVRRVAQR